MPSSLDARDRRFAVRARAPTIAPRFRVVRVRFINLVCSLHGRSKTLNAQLPPTSSRDRLERSMVVILAR